MDDLYAINVAKTEFREAYNTASPERLLGLLDPGFVNFSDGRECAFGDGARTDLEKHLQSLFANYTVNLAVVVIEIRIVGDLAYDYGWHTFTLTRKDGGEFTERKDRYVDIWKRNQQGEWKLWMFMDNRDVPMKVITVAAD